MVKAQSKSVKSREINANGLYLFFISRDLKKIIDLIVPEGRQGLPNLISTKQVRYEHFFLLFHSWNFSLKTFLSI
jgi:CTD kinase subunit gamma